MEVIPPKAEPAGDIVAILKIASLLLLFFGTCIWLLYRKLTREETDDEFGLLLFRWMLGIIVVLCVWWWVVPMILNGMARGNQFAVIVGMNVLATCCVVFGLCIAPGLVGWIISPFTSAFDGGSEKYEREPLYSPAIVKRNMGEIPAAMRLIEEQLEAFPYNFEGMMMIAEIQAHDLNDLASAEETLQELFDHGSFPKKKQAYALTTLADWHLKINNDTAAARRIFERIVEMFPKSEIANRARQRALHLPSEETAAARAKPQTHSLDGVTPFQTADTAPSIENEAQELVDRLQSEPGDYEARERLAVIYADHYRQVDMAIDQLNQLIAAPNQSRDNVVRWLNLIADFQWRILRDGDAASATLRSIAAAYPGTAAAHAAEEAARAIPSTEVMQAESAPVPMVEAEKDLGLKRRKGRT